MCWGAQMHSSGHPCQLRLARESFFEERPGEGDNIPMFKLTVRRPRPSKRRLSCTHFLWGSSRPCSETAASLAGANRAAVHDTVLQCPLNS